MARKLAALLRDLLKAVLIGAAAGAALGIVFFLCGLCFGGLDTGVEACKNGLLVVFAGFLFVVAGMLLIRGKNPERIALEGDYRKHFSLIGPKTMLLALSVGILVLVIGIDALQRGQR